MVDLDVKEIQKSSWFQAKRFNRLTRTPWEYGAHLVLIKAFDTLKDVGHVAQHTA